MASGVTINGLVAGDSSRRWLVTAVQPLRQAHEALPQAPTITSVFAGVMRARNELKRALALYDEALAIRPGHGEALFGRTITLSFLRRYDEATAAATEIISRNRGHVASAYYYRAWNAYQKTQLDEAARDIATATRMRAPEEVLVLSGMIAYDQKRPVDARRDFDAAILENPGRCTAQWYLGLLDLDEEKWPPAVTSFATSAQCYVTSAMAFQREVARLPSDLPEDIRAEQVATLAQNLEDSRKQAGRSFYNAAQAAMRAGDAPTALLHAQKALTYEVVRERAEMIVKRLER
jgi:tetratricopeptide (TPR) repeat protein